MREITAKAGQSIRIGKRGENNAVCVMFDISDWQALHGAGNVQLIHQRNGDKVPYPCVVEVSGGAALWTITKADVDNPGMGRAELQYWSGDALVKSATFSTITTPAMEAPTDEPPEPIATWMEDMLKLGLDATKAAAAEEKAALSANAAADSEEKAASHADSARKNANTSGEARLIAVQSATLAEEYCKRAEATVGKTPYISDNGLWAVWDEEAGHYVHSIKAQGPAGKNGKDGQSVTAEVVAESTSGGAGNVIRFYTADGAEDLTVYNGRDGHTPVRGDDYWTPADQAVIVNDVLNALPKWNGGSY